MLKIAVAGSTFAAAATGGNVNKEEKKNITLNTFTYPLLCIHFAELELNQPCGEWYVDVHDGITTIGDFVPQHKNSVSCAVPLKDVKKKLHSLIKKFAAFQRHVNSIRTYTGNAGPSHAFHKGKWFVRLGSSHDFREIGIGDPVNEVTVQE